MLQGYYPGYQEPQINFLPSYKCSTSEKEVYVNKKDQAPSYCDRVIYKNNSSDRMDVDFYHCLHEFFGSDHRPVMLGTTIRDFGQPRFQELPRLLNMDQP